MANLNIEMPDDLVWSLEGIAAAQHKRIQQLAPEQLRPLVDDVPERRFGFPAAVLRVMQDPPHPLLRTLTSSMPLSRPAFRPVGPAGKRVRSLKGCPTLL